VVGVVTDVCLDYCVAGASVLRVRGAYQLHANTTSVAARSASPATTMGWCKSCPRAKSKEWVCAARPSASAATSPAAYVRLNTERLLRSESICGPLPSASATIDVSELIATLKNDPCPTAALPVQVGPSWSGASNASSTVTMRSISVSRLPRYDRDGNVVSGSASNRQASTAAYQEDQVQFTSVLSPGSCLSVAVLSCPAGGACNRSKRRCAECLLLRELLLAPKGRRYHAEFEFTLVLKVAPRCA
jgi:hypothetical protein